MVDPRIVKVEVSCDNFDNCQGVESCDLIDHLRTLLNNENTIRAELLCRQDGQPVYSWI